jgi:acetyl coenzyme A synthetase (ADP forming)-like protein
VKTIKSKIRQKKRIGTRMDPSLAPFFQPTGVVVVGASGIPSKLGYGVARNLINSGFAGEIHFVSQKRGNLFGRPVYLSLGEVPDPVDLAVLIVPASAICSALKECQQRGIFAAIVVSSGFREIGGEGVKLENEMMRIAENAGIRLIGPNCIGLLDTHFPLDTTFLPPPLPTAGDVAFISQSGAICAAIIDWARGQGFGFSRLISLGNQADVNETDMLSAVVEDDHTRVLTLYIESVSNGLRFVEEASRITRQKPVIALKVGRFSSGQRAAASHTGALAGQDIAYQAAFKRAGVFRASTSEEMFDWASALACCPLPKGRRMAVLTNAGGPGVIAADALEINGLTLADLSPETRTSLSSLLPPAAGLNNPIDMLASASPQVYADCLKLLITDPGVDGIMVILPPPPMYTAENIANEMIPIIQSASKPVVIALMGEQLIKNASACFRDARIPEYRFPERAASALFVLARRAEFMKSTPIAPIRFPDMDLLAGRKLLISTSPGAWLDPRLAEKLMQAYGIPVSQGMLATTPEEARVFSTRIGFPIVVKIASPDILHKSDIGGVVLNIQTPDEAEEGFLKLIEKARTEKPEARIEGVHIQQMVDHGQEVIIGSVRDAHFGALMMFGSGGVEVEGLKDIAFSLAPLSEQDSQDLIQETWAGRKLKGYRNIPKADTNAVINILQRLSFMASDLPEIQEVEMNPLRVFSNGAIVLDVRVKL